MPWITLTETLDIPPPSRSGPVPDARWAVQIEGDTADIEDLKRSLNGCFEGGDDPSIVELQGVLSLTTRAWDAVDEPSQIEALSKAMLNDCVACINMLNACGTMKVGTLYEYKASACTMTRYSHVKITVKQAPENRASPESFKALYWLAKRERWLADCLPVYFDEPDFYSIYKAVEAIMGHCGGEHKMKKRADIDGGKLAKIKNVADYHRHIQKPKRVKPMPFYSEQECVEVVTIAIGILANERLRELKRAARG